MGRYEGQNAGFSAPVYYSCDYFLRRARVSMLTMLLTSYAALGDAQLL